MTDNETDIITNQLQGIMDCTEMIRLSYFLDSPQVNIHKHRLKCLMKIYLCTQQRLIKKYQQIDPLPEVQSSTTIKTMKQLVTSWVDWCESAIELYAKEDGDWWKYLHKLHVKDLHLAQRYLPSQIPSKPSK